jgi:hypothetical protein
MHANRGFAGNDLHIMEHHSARKDCAAFHRLNHARLTEDQKEERDGHWHFIKTLADVYTKLCPTQPLVEDHAGDPNRTEEHTMNMFEMLDELTELDRDDTHAGVSSESSEPLFT